MGRGNVCVTGPYEGLFYIDNDDIHVYRRDDQYAEEPEVRLMRDLDYAELTGGEWLYDEWGTGEEQDDIEECFVDAFGRMFTSFTRVEPQRWAKNGPYGDLSRRVIMENKLFLVALEDNEWSMAVELIQKEDPYDDSLCGLQKRHFERYLDGIKKCLLDRLPSIGTRTGAWTSGTIRREDIA